MASAGGLVHFRILGPLEVLRAGERVDIAGRKPRQLLALLLLNANQIVSTDRIIDDLWGDEGSKDKEQALWVHVNTLRKALDPSRERGADPTILLTRSPGYLLRVEEGALDSEHAERLIREGRALLHSDPQAASIVLSEALALWRGHPLEDFTYEPWASLEIARLEELRLEGTEARIDADLESGGSGELVGELESLVKQHPLRENFTAQLMTALYRSGRQAEALRAYRGLSEHLGEELGIEPGADLKLLEDQVLTNDPVLEVTSVSLSGLQPGLSIRGYELREVIGEGAFGIAYRAYQPSVGREVAIKVIKPELANDPRFIRRFESEARIVAGLEHPHVVPLYDYWREPDAAYLVMPLMTGGSLSDRLAADDLDDDLVERLVSQVGSALDAAHRRGVIHRDIKPDNILLDGDGNAFLADFSIATGEGLEGSESSLPYSLLAPYASPEHVEGGPVTEVSDVFSLATVLKQVVAADDDRVGAVLDRATSSDPEARFGDVGALMAAMHAALGTTSRATTARPGSGINPYKGLRPFEMEDQGRFFGRERVVERLVTALGHNGAAGRFVAVVGPSGIGKSSVVNAGLIPALRRGALPGSETWFIASMMPAPHPFEELADALSAVATTGGGEVLAGVTKNHRGLATTIPGIMPDDGSQLVLVIDQFEELFTQVDDAETERFLASLVEAVEDSHSRLRVVVTLRADFFDRPLADHEFGRLLRESTEVVTAMAPAELERAITGPAETQGVSFEPALVAQMVTDVVDRPGALPLLQYTLTELFDRRNGNVVRLSDYTALGGVAGTLANRAEGIYNEFETPGRDAARQVFLSLVTVGEGVADTRHRLLTTRVEDAAGGQDVAAVLDAFGRHRLLTFDRDPMSRGPTVEIAHEALLSVWPRLRRWIDGSREGLRVLRRLETSASVWLDKNRDAGFYLREGPLAQAEEHLTDARVRPSAAVRTYLTESRRHVDQQRSSRRRRRQTITGGFAAAAMIALVLAAAALVARSDATEQADIAAEQRDAAVASAELADTNAAQAAQNAAEAEVNAAAAEASATAAEASRIEARSQALGAQATVVLDEDPELALLLALRAAELSPDNLTARSALRQALAKPPVIYTYEASEGTVVGGDISPDGTRFVAGSVGGTIIEMRDIATGDLVWSKEFPWEQEDQMFGLDSAHFISDGSEVVVTITWQTTRDHEVGDAGDRPGVYVWDAATGAELRRHPAGPCGAEFSMVERSERYAVLIERTAASIDEFGCRLWDDVPSAAHDLYRLDLTTGERTLFWSDAVFDAQFSGPGILTSLSADGRVASTGTLDEEGIPVGVRIVDVETGTTLLAIQAEDTMGVGTTTLNADGSLVALIGGATFPASPSSIFDVSSGRRLATIAGHPTGPWGAWFIDDGRLMTSGRDGTIRFWDPLLGTEIDVLRGGDAGDWLARITPDGTRIAQFSFGLTARVVSLDPADRTEVGAIDVCAGPGFYASWGIVAAGDRALLRVFCEDSAVGAYLVDLNTLEVIATRDDITGQHLALSPDGTLIAAQEFFPDRGEEGWAGTITITDAASGAEVARMEGLCEVDEVTLEGPDCAAPPDLPLAAWNTKMAWSPDGSLLAMFTWWPNLITQVWDAGTGRSLTVITGAAFPAFSPQGDRMVLLSYDDDALRIYDTTTFDVVAEQEIPPGFQGAVGKFSPDGSQLVLDENFVLTVRDAATLELDPVIAADSEESVIRDHALSSTGTLVAIGHDSGFIRVWDYTTGELVDSFDVGGAVKAVAFVDDDRRLLVTMGSNGPIGLFTLDPAELISIARERVTRGFAADECVRYSIDPCSTFGEIRAG